MSRLLLLFFANLALAVADDIPIVDGGWTEWEDAGQCCGNYVYRTRSCTNPPPSGGGNFCAGPSRLPFTCPVDECTQPWSDWSDWSLCCNGEQSRTRECNSPAQAFCQGDAEQRKTCDRADGSTECFEPNLITAMCDPKLPDAGTNTATARQVATTATPVYTTITECCESTFAGSGVTQCLGDLAPEGDRPINGGFGPWSNYTSCCEGTQARFRACDSPRPSNGGDDCVGEFVENRQCQPDTCEAVDFGGSTLSSGFTIVASLWSALAGLVMAFH